MSKVVHPYAHRLVILRDWKSRWFADEKKFNAPESPLCKVKVFDPEAFREGFVPPSIRLPDDSTGIWLPLADCEGVYPPTVFELIA